MKFPAPLSKHRNQHGNIYLYMYAEKWESSTYLFAYDSYDKNEHCMMTAIAKLLMRMSTIQSILDPQVLNISSSKRLFQVLPEQFLRLSSQILLQLRLMDHTS